MCTTCEDKGYVVLTEIWQKVHYQYGYRCFCEAGNRRTDLAGWRVMPIAMRDPIGMEVQVEIPEEWRAERCP